MGILDIGEREAHNQANSHAHGKRSGIRCRPLSPSRARYAMSRDTLLENEIKAIQEHVKEDFLTAKFDKNEAKPTGVRPGENSKVVRNEIFGAPQAEKPRVMRLRPDFQEDELAKLMQPDTRKTEAAEAMAEDKPMVDKMLAYNYPLPRPTDPHAKRKRSFVEPPPKIEPPVVVEGFRGMGQKEAGAEKRQGLACKPVEPFFIEPKVPFPFTTRRKKSISSPITGHKIGVFDGSPATAR